MKKDRTMKFSRILVDQVKPGDVIIANSNINMFQVMSVDTRIEAVILTGSYFRYENSGFLHSQVVATHEIKSTVLKVEDEVLKVPTMPKFMVVLTDVKELDGDPDLMVPVLKTVKFFEMLDTMKMYLYDNDNASFIPLVYEFVDGIPVERKYRITTKTVIDELILT